MSAVLDEKPLEGDVLPALGVHTDIPAERYHHGPGMNKHGLDLIRECPARYVFEKANPRPSTPAMVFGSALHCLVLEPDVFPEQYTRPPKDMPRKPTDAQRNAANPSPKTLDQIAAYDAWVARWEAEGAGKIIISDQSDPDKGVWGMSDWDKLHAMRDSVMRHEIASIILADSINELTMYWMDPDTGRLCRGRADAYNEAHGIMADLKSANSAGMSDFSRAVHDLRYDVQDAWYTDGARRCDLPVAAFMFIAVEKEPPFLCACYQLEPNWKRIGRSKYRQDMQVFDQCKRTGEWPGYTPPLRDLVTPGYAQFSPVY